MIVDYTTKPEGSAVSRAGVIARCPVCGRMGERRKRKAKGTPWLFVHVARISASGNNANATELIEKCVSPNHGTTPLAAQTTTRATQLVLGR